MSFKNLVFRKQRFMTMYGQLVVRLLCICSQMSNFIAIWSFNWLLQKSLYKCNQFCSSQISETWTVELQDALESFNLNGDSTTAGSETVLLVEIGFLFGETPLKYYPLVKVFAEILVNSHCCPSGSFICYLGSYKIRKVVRTEGPDKLLNTGTAFCIPLMTYLIYYPFCNRG